MHNAARLEALAESQRALLAAGGNFGQLFDIIVDRSIAAIPTAQGAIVELLEADDLIFYAASGAARRYVGRRLPAAGSVAGRSIAAGTALIVADLETEKEIDLPRYREVGMRALMAVPFRQGEHSVGAIKFYSHEPAAFADVDLDVARLITGQLIGSMALVREQATERERQAVTARMEAISDTLPQMIWATAPDGRIVGHNRLAYEWLRLGREGVYVTAMFEQGFLDAGISWEQVRAAGVPVSFESQLETPSGCPKWFLINLAPIVLEDGRIEEWVGIATDIDRLKTLENSLQDAVRSRELLLVEVNHRAKNSLQIITGLLAMHAGKIAHPEARARLMDARAQIGTIAQVYETIYQSSQQDEVEFIALIRSLATGLAGGAGTKAAKLVFDVPDALMLPIQRGVPVALIAGEIITNAIKHAAGASDTTITIAIRRGESDYRIEIADDGPGLPANFDPGRSAGLGMDIIFGLAKQIGGEVTIDRRRPGARFHLRLPR